MSEQLILVPGKFVPFEAGTPLMDEKDIKKTSQVDSEDVKTEGGVLKFADKAYVPNDFSGMGRVYLRKNMINASLHFADIISDLPSTEIETLFDCDEIVYETTNNRFLAVKHTSEGKKYYPNYQFTGSEAYSEPDDKHIYVCDANAKLYTYENDALEETTTLMDKNVLTQDMINKPNTIYIIQYDYDIVDLEETTTTNNLTIGDEYYGYKPITIADNQTYRALNDCVFVDYHHNSLIGSVLVTGENESQDYAIAKKSSAVSGVPVSYYSPNGTINVPANCVLQFEGGSIKSGTIVGNGTKIDAGLNQIFGTDVEFAGIWQVKSIYPEWFGALGNYNVNTHTGTDDSIPISKAIDVANSININVVQLSSALYAIGTGININIGNIKIVGTYANLREDNRFSYLPTINSTLGSSFISLNSESIINVNTKATHPIDIENVGFYNLFLDTHFYNSNAVTFKCEFTGPLWPVVFKKCHFFGFNRAIYLDSTLLYCLSDLTIEDCSFFRNNVCVKYAEKEVGSLLHNYTYSFFFRRNKAHGNGHVLDIAVMASNLVIEENNLEGPLIYYNDDTPIGNRPVSYLYITSGACVSISNNYMEALSNRLPFKITITEATTEPNLLSNMNYLRFKNNMSFRTDDYWVDIHTSAPTDYLASKLNLKLDSDTAVYVTGSLHIFEDNKIPSIILGNSDGCVWLHTKSPITRRILDYQDRIEFDKVVSSADLTISEENIPIIKTIGDSIFFKRNGASNSLANSIVPTDADSKYFVIIGRVLSLNDNYNYAPAVAFTDDRDTYKSAYLVGVHGYEWCYCARKISQFTKTSNYISYITAGNSYVESAQLMIFNSADLNFCGIPMKTKKNTTKSLFVNSITDCPNGFSVYLSDIKKAAYKDTNGWVDAEGELINAE